MNQHGEPLPPDSPDATLRALGLLETPAVRVEDRDTFHAHERGVQETAAAVWLAVSPLRAAPPEILENIHARCGISPSGQAAPRRFHGLRRALMAGGWAAAAVACAGWWRAASGSYGSPGAAQAVTAAATGARNSSPGAPGTGRPGGDSPLPVGRPHRAPSESDSPGAGSGEDSRLRGELKRLRLLVAEADTPRPGEARPRVRELRPPGAPPRSAKAASARVTAALTAALERTMREESGRKEASLVIEDGWVNGGGLELPENGTVLHRRFPAEEWAARGLWKAEDGRFYDPAGGLVWSPGAGKKEYVGKRAGSQEDLTAFSSPPPQPDPAAAATGGAPADGPPPATMASRQDALAQSAALSADVPPPEGYVVEDPASGESTLLVQNLPQPEPGMENVALVTSSVDGSLSSYVLNFDGGGWVWSNASQGQFLTADGIPVRIVSNGLSNNMILANGTGMTSMTLPSGAFSSLQIIRTASGSTITSLGNLPPGSTVLLDAGH